MPSIFLSHSSKDKALIMRIANDLRAQEVEVWLDEWEIKIGDSIAQKISRGLDDMELVAVFLTQNSIDSGWVEKEWQSRIGEEASNRKVLILPILLENCKVPRLLRDKKYADFTADYTAGFNSLLESVRLHSPRRITTLFMLGFNTEHPTGWMTTLGFQSTLNIDLAIHSYQSFCKTANVNSRLVAPASEHVICEGDPNSAILGPLVAFDWQTLQPLDGQLAIGDIKRPHILLMARRNVSTFVPELKKFFLREVNFAEAIEIWLSSKDSQGKCPIRFYYRSNGYIRAEKVEGTP